MNIYLQHAAERFKSAMALAKEFTEPGPDYDLRLVQIATAILQSADADLATSHLDDINTSINGISDQLFEISTELGNRSE